MSTSTSSVRFVVGYKNAHGGLSTLGTAVVKGARCTLDSNIAATYPKGTVTYEQIKKACKWLASESASMSADFTTRHNMQLKAVKLTADS